MSEINDIINFSKGQFKSQNIVIFVRIFKLMKLRKFENIQKRLHKITLTRK